MKDWIPLIQTAVQAVLAWPLVVLVLAYIFRDRLLKIVDAIRVRIESGDPFEAGTSGVKLGQSPGASLTKPRIVGDFYAVTGPGFKAAGEAKEGGERTPAPQSSSLIGVAPPSVYLVHTARRARDLDQGERQYYRLRIFLEGEEDTDLDCVARVVYHLHPTFPSPTRVVNERETNFELRTVAWGQFSLTADVYLRGETEPLTLQRYLNF